MGTYSKLSKLKKPEPVAGVAVERGFEPPSRPTAERSPTPQTRGVIQKRKAAKKQSVDANMHAHKYASKHAYMHALLDQKATHSFAFRYPPELLEKLEGIVHDVWREHKAKLTKNSMAVAAMGFLLWDFETNGEESVLYKQLVEKLGQ